MKIVHHEPLGVTVRIILWNAPFPMAIYKVSASLAAGNCYIYEPSEKSTLRHPSPRYARQSSWLPPGLFQVLTGDGSTSSLLSHHMRIQKVSFTGSVSIEKKDLAAVATDLKRSA